MASRGSWMKLSCGDRVCDTEDPRHVGRIEAIEHGYEVTVKWFDSGWFSFVAINKLRRVQ